MVWQIPLILSITFGYITQPFLIKKVAQLSSRARNLVWQYFFSALLATTTALICGASFGNKQFFVVGIIGAANAFGCYCHWRAVAISLSKTSLFTQADDLTALALGYIILREGKFLNPLLSIGIIFCLGAAFILSYAKSHSRQGDKHYNIFIWIAAYSIIWGIAMFSMRYFALGGMSILSFMAAWYEGSFCGACLVFMLSSKKEKGEPLTWQQIPRVIPLAVNIWITLMIVYWVRMLAPITVAQPIWQVSEMILPTIVGLWIFKEFKELHNIERMAMVVGVTGGLIIMFSY